MAPKKKELSKSGMKKVEKFVEDKTFGLKNKNKSMQTLLSYNWQVRKFKNMFRM